MSTPESRDVALQRATCDTAGNTTPFYTVDQFGDRLAPVGVLDAEPQKLAQRYGMRQRLVSTGPQSCFD
jgi:hypothetical protein